LRQEALGFIIKKWFVFLSLAFNDQNILFNLLICSFGFSERKRKTIMILFQKLKTLDFVS